METGSQVVKFDVTEAAIAELKEKYGNPVVPETKDEYDALKASIKEVSQLRIKVDKERKEQNAAALAHQREVNRIGHGIINQLKDIEEPMKLCKAEVDEAEDRRVREIEEREAARLEKINTRIANIEAYGVVSINDSLDDVKQRLARVEELDPIKGFDEFVEKASKVRETSLQNLKAGIEALEKQAELDKKAKELEEREAEINKRTAEADAAEAKRKAEEQAEEQARLRKLEEDQKERERAAEVEAEKARRLELAPDREKLMVYAQALREVTPPALDSVAGCAAIAAVVEDVKTLCSDIESTADRL